MRNQCISHVGVGYFITLLEAGLSTEQQQHHRHWVGIHVLFDSKTVEYHDPFWNIRSKSPGLAEGHGTKTLRYYYNFMRGLFTAFYPSEDLMREEMQKWTFKDMKRNTAQQDNGFDCGLFVFKGFFDSCRDQVLSGINKKFRKQILISFLKGHIDFEEI